MLDEGYTLDGAAQALGWTRQLVTARAKILKLPLAGQQLVGSGEIPVSAIDNLLQVAAVSPAIADAVALTIATGEVAGSQLVRDPSWTISRALHNAAKGTFGAYLNHVDTRELAKLRLGKKITALVDEATKLHKQVDQHAYGPPTFRFTEADVDQARAAGVLLEFADARTAIVCDHAVYRELVKQAITRTVTELRERAAAKAQTKRSSAAQRARTPREQLDSEHRANLRELTRQAHGVNLDVGAALLTELAMVAPDDINVAAFFAYGVLGPATSNYLGSSDHVARTLAANGLRLVLDEHRTTTTPTLKSGQPGKTKVAYGDVDDALKWLLRFVDGAKTAGELFWGSEGRTGWSEIGREGPGGAPSLRWGSVRTGWDRREPCSAHDPFDGDPGSRLRCDPCAAAWRSWLLERSRRRVRRCPGGGRVSAVPAV